MHHLTGKPEGESGSHESSQHGKDDEDREESERHRRKGKTRFSLAGVIHNWLCCVLDLATVELCISPQKMLGEDLETPKWERMGSFFILQHDNMRRVVVSDHESRLQVQRSTNIFWIPSNQLRSSTVGAD